MPWEVGDHLENGIYPYHIFLCETEYEGAEGKVYPGNAHGVPLVKRNRFKAHLWYTHKECRKSAGKGFWVFWEEMMELSHVWATPKWEHFKIFQREK